ncbi:MAG: PDZ domain-containing protein [Planctomycetota bacterium]|jgi:hypothetical protein
MNTSRLALLTLVLGLGLGAGLGLLLGDGGGSTVEAAGPAVPRFTGTPGGGDRASASRGDMASPLAAGRSAAPAADRGVADRVLDADASAASRATIARLEGGAEEEAAAGSGTIRGVAFDENGAPLPGVTIVCRNREDPTAWSASEESTQRVGRAWRGPANVEEQLADSARDLLSARRRQRTATTDGEGRFEMSGLRAGEHSLSAYYEGLVFRSRDVHAGETATFIGTAVSEYRLELRLPDGSSPEEALLLVGTGRRPETHGWTREEPTVRLSKPTASIQALAGDVRRLEYRRYVSDFTSEVEFIDLDRDGDGPHLIQLEPRSVLRVSVEDRSDLEPPVKPWVRVVEASKAEGKEPGEVFGEGRSMERGWGDAYVATDLDEGAYLIGAGRGNGPAEVTAEVQLTGGLVEESLVLDGVDLSRFLVVRCSGPGGRKLSGVSFRVRVERADDSDTNGPSAITRGPGEYWLPFTGMLGKEGWTGVESAELSATVEGYGELVRPITQGQTEVALAFEPSAELVVRVAGDVSPGFSVRAVSIVRKENGSVRTLSSSRESQRVDAEGEAVITGLQPGLFRVELRKASSRGRGRGEAIATEEVTVRAGSQEVSFVAPTFHDVVVYAPDLPAGTGFWMQRKGGRGNGWWGGNDAKLDEDHRARFKEVASGEYDLMCWNGGGRSKMEVTVPTGEVLWEERVVNAYRVKSISPGKLAEKAGLQVGDVVTAVNGKEIDEDDFWQRLTLDLETEAVPLTIDRNGAVMQVDLGPGKPAGGNVWPQIGVEWEGVSR